MEDGDTAPLVSSPIFTKAELSKELRQAEIISGLTQYFYDPHTKDVEPLTHPFAVVLTQDCDLLRDYESRNAGSAKPLSSVLIYIAELAKELKPSIGPDIWRRVIGNNNERYHLLSPIPPECDLLGTGIPNLILDFKDFFTLPPEEIYKQCASGQAHRRSRLDMPYREHLQCRAAFYFQRIMLPEPHKYVAI